MDFEESVLLPIEPDEDPLALLGVLLGDDVLPEAPVELEPDLLK